MNWVAGLSLLALLLFLGCVAILGYCALRDRAHRGMRIRGSEIDRERITITLPNFAMRDFKDRTP